MADLYVVVLRQGDGRFYASIVDGYGPQEVIDKVGPRLKYSTLVAVTSAEADAGFIRLIAVEPTQSYRVLESPWDGFN